MKTVIRLLSFLLSLATLLVCFASCGDNGTTNGESDIDANTVDGKELPNINWGGVEYRVLGRDGGEYEVIFRNFEIMREECPTDVVGEAIYKRNEALANKYGFTVTQQLVEDTQSTMQLACDSGDDLYDLAIYIQNKVQAHAQSGYLLDLKSEVEHIDLDHPSWNSYINEQLTIGDKLYYTTSDFLLQDKHRIQFMFYNRDLAANLNLGYFEDMVDNNTWTLENFGRIATLASADIDGISGMSENDRFGFAMENYTYFGGLFFSAGMRMTEMDKNGYPRLVGATDKIINIIDRVLDVTSNKNVTYLMQRQYDYDAAYEHLFNHFSDGRILIISEYASFYDEWLYDIDFSTGVVPNPKFDETQEMYGTYPDIYCGSVFAVPYTVADTEKAGFCLEALTEASTDTTYTAYIDTKCKYQDAYDEDCARMLDICFNNVIYDIGAFCDFGEIYTNLHYSLAKSGLNAYNRLFDSNETAAQKEIDKLIEEYQKRG